MVSAVVLAAGGLASGLLAYFSGAASAGSAGGAAATSVAPGTPPTSVSSQPGRAVTLSWEATALANGQPVDGYLVTRYDANPPYAPQITLAGCGGVVTALSCTETAVPFGSWQYTITPVIGANWRGTESTKSGTVTIGAGSLTLAQSTLGLAAFSGGSSPATLSGSLSGFASHEGITYRLDDSTSGTTLAGSPAAADGSGNATVSITLPRPADGSHSIFAVGDAVPYPSQASAAILVDTPAPTSSASGVDAAWHASDVVVGLSATDGVGGSGVDDDHVPGRTEDRPRRSTGTSGNVTVPAPADGSNDGTHTIAFYATDDAGNVEAPAQTATVKIDATKPSTTLATTPASPDGSNGWFQQASVQFSLAGSDARSGVAQSFYTVDGGATQTYTGAVTVSGQGTHTITYWSVDNAGNTEAADTGHDQARQRQAVDLDRGHPREPERLGRLVRDDAVVHAERVRRHLGRGLDALQDRQRGDADLFRSGLDPRRPAHDHLLVGRQRRQHRERDHDLDDQGRHGQAVDLDHDQPGLA